MNNQDKMIIQRGGLNASPELFEVMRKGQMEIFYPIEHKEGDIFMVCNQATGRKSEVDAPSPAYRDELFRIVETRPVDSNVLQDVMDAMEFADEFMPELGSMTREETVELLQQFQQIDRPLRRLKVEPVFKNREP